MTSKDFEKFIMNFRADQDKLLTTKGHDYTQGSDDRLSNFKDVARMLGIDPLQVWAIYWLKHVFAICTYIKCGELKASEGIESRFFDESNYNLLGLALIKEKEQPFPLQWNKGSRVHELKCQCEYCVAMRVLI